MPYGYQWLTREQRKYVHSLAIGYDGYGFWLNAYRTSRDLSTFLVIDYNRVEGKSGASTMLKHIDSREMWVDDNVINVLSQDIQEFLKNQRVNMYRFEFTLTLSTIWEEFFTLENVSAPLSRLYREMETSLKSRTRRLRAEVVKLAVIDMHKVIPLLLQFDPVVLKKIVFVSPFEISSIDADALKCLTQWNRGERISLVFVLKSLTCESAKSVKTLLSCTTTFNFIRVLYEEFSPKCLAAFSGISFIQGDKPLVPSKSKLPVKTITFLLKTLNKSNSICKTLNLLHANQPSTSQDHEYSRKIFENRVILGAVLTNLQCSSIQCLRKVSRGIRKAVDQVKPNPQVEAYRFEIKPQQFDVYFDEEEGGKIVACRVLSSEYLDENFLKKQSEAVTDFIVNIKNQKTRLQKLEFIFADRFSNVRTRSKEEQRRFHSMSLGFLKMFGEMLTEQEQLLRVKTLRMCCEHQSMIMQILPYIEVDSLEVIQLASIDIFAKHRLEYDRQHRPVILEIDQVSRLEQWRNAKESIFSSFMVSTTIQEMNITHFANIHVMVQTVSHEDIFYLKQELIKSSTLKKFKIAFETSEVDDNLHSLIGEPYRRVNDFRSIWYFRIEKTNHYLHFVLHKSRQENGTNHKGSLLFARVDQESTPFF